MSSKVELMSNATLNLQTAPGHQVLAAAGKRILRPGGRAATQQLFRWAEFKPGEMVLELAASFGDSAIALAKRYGVCVVGIEKNPDSVARAVSNVAANGLSDRIQIIEGDIFHLEQVNGQFDYVLAEAILTMQSPSGKIKILQGVCDRLKPGGKFLCHELLVQNNESEIHQALSRVIRVNATPYSESNWIATFATAGLQVQHHQIGKMGLLNIQQMLYDEGIIGTAQVLWNILTKPLLRQRVLQMRQVFNQYKQDLGHIILCAQRP